MEQTFPKTCVAPSGEFVYGIHKPQFTSINLRKSDYIVNLGNTVDQKTIDNADNFPDGDVRVDAPTWIFEIPNAFPFMGATFIIKSNADRTVGGCNPFSALLSRSAAGSCEADLQSKSREILLALASTCNDPEVLANLAQKSCRFTYDEKTRTVSGIIYEEDGMGRFRPAILDHHLFQLLSNNPFLPDVYKRYMVLIPGAQGKSPIVGEYAEADTHIWEYLRDNSYIPWGHCAANMAHDAIRYRINSLTEADIFGLRHLYYQRVYVQLAAELGLPVGVRCRSLTAAEMENLRLGLLDEIAKRCEAGDRLPFNGVVWGQNFGFDLSSSEYRLAASHQQVHQQFALVRRSVPAFKGGRNVTSFGTIPSFSQADQVAQFTTEYRERTKVEFFETYLKAIRSNKRMDGRRDVESNLVFHQDENIIAFVPKAQRFQGEVQVMTEVRCGNIIETDAETRRSLDRAILLAMKVLENLGVEMLTALEISKRLDNPDSDQRLLYCFLPRHPQSPGGFSEFQQRWISNHYPEDFAKVCREEAQKITGNDA
jgi:hypothetical protein